MQTVSKTLHRAFYLFPLVAMLSGCTNLKPVSGQRTIRGIPSDRAEVVVSTSAIGRTQDLRLDMAPARCTPVAATGQGVYFQSDKQVFIRSWVILNPRMVPGGVFVPDDITQPCKLYYSFEGHPVRTQKTEDSISAAIIDTATQKRMPLRID